MSPTLIGIVPSIEMVIFCAVGGRLSIQGAVYGALLVNWAKTTFSESFPELWLFGLGALFIGVVLAFPYGLAGLFEDHVKPRAIRLFRLIRHSRGASTRPAPNPPAE
jgi:urea transport system permease protein